MLELAQWIGLEDWIVEEGLEGVRRGTQRRNNLAALALAMLRPDSI